MTPVPRRIPISSMALALLALTLGAPAAAADATKPLRAELPASAAWGVDNLAGTMRVVPGSGPSVVVIATVHAESDEAAATLRLEQVAGENGEPTLRVRYPEGTTAVRYPGRDRKGHESSLLNWFGGSNTTLDYDGRHMKISTTDGTLLYADLEVQVPARAAHGALRNHVGVLDAHGLDGSLLFDTASGDVRLQEVRGDIKVDTGSGDVSARQAGGSWKCDTGSGDVVVEDFKGDSLNVDVGSGDVKIDRIGVSRLKVDTGSGDVTARGVDAEEFVADTGSGDVLLEAEGARLGRVKADTGSGDVTLRLGAQASFEAHASQGSGDLVNRYADAQPILKGRQVVGYRRGDGKTQITIETGSGDCTLEPGGGKAAR